MVYTFPFESVTKTKIYRLIFTQFIKSQRGNSLYRIACVCNWRKSIQKINITYHMNTTAKHALLHISKRRVYRAVQFPENNQSLTCVYLHNSNNFGCNRLCMTIYTVYQLYLRKCCSFSRPLCGKVCYDDVTTWNAFRITRSFCLESLQVGSLRRGRKHRASTYS